MSREFRPWTFVAGFFGIALAALVGLFLWIGHQVGEAMFKPRPRDRVQLSAALAKRFGSKVRLVDVPYVNRDINGTVGIVETTPGFVPHDVEEPGFVLSFERKDGRLLAFSARQPWEVQRMRKQYP